MHEGCVSRDGLRVSKSGASVWCLNTGQVSALVAMYKHVVSQERSLPLSKIVGSYSFSSLL